jgi:Zn-dependent peptidase ImmA (M78 family)
LRVEELVAISRFLGEEVNYFLAPARGHGETIGVTLRAEVAGLPLPEFSAAINAFVDEVEEAPLPDPLFNVGSSTPEAAAREVLSKRGQARLPIPVSQIARDLGVAVFIRPFPNALSALILRHGSNAFIGVNSHHAPVRQRFSIAHELGHFVLHHADHHFIEYADDLGGETPGYDWENERAANQFAAELLMPAESLRKDARTTSVARLARRYDVSQEAMGFRMAHLGI